VPQLEHTQGNFPPNKTSRLKFVKCFSYFSMLTESIYL